MQKLTSNKDLFSSLLKILAIILLITLLSYKFFLTNFEDIEKQNNKNNITSILTVLNDHLRNLENITLDYAHWDDTYDFIEGNDEGFLFENFRENADSIEVLNFDFMIFTDLKNKKIFSVFTKDTNRKESQEIEEDILNKFESRNQFASLYTQKSFLLKEQENFYLIVKAPISNSDNSIANNGFLYSGKKISNTILNEMTKIFTQITITNTKLKDGYFIDSDYLKNIKIKTSIEENENTLKNIIELSDYRGKYTTSIKTLSNRELIKKGKETIFIYNFIFAIFLFIIFFQVYRSKLFLQNYNKKLKKEVNKKTSELKKMNEILRKISYTDELTQISNRRDFFEKGEKLLVQSVIEKKNFFILMLDIDNFKKVNDTFGHDIGDKVLIHLCEIINNILKEKHIFARLGGEEFAIIFFDITDDAAYIITETIRNTVEKAKIDVEGIKLRYTLSIGLAQRNELIEIDQILKEADKLLYNAKHRGKNCIIRDR